MELIPRNSNDRICTFMATVVSIDRTANTMTIDGGPIYGVMSGVKIHFHCENPFELVSKDDKLFLSESEPTVANGHLAFHDGDCVRVLGLSTLNNLPTPDKCYVIGFKDFRRRCYPPAGCHLSGGLISGPYAYDTGIYDCGNTNMAFGNFLSENKDRTQIFQTVINLELGEYWFFNPQESYPYLECVICPPFECANLLDTSDPDTISFSGVINGWEVDKFPDNNNWDYEPNGESLDGIALTENCRLDLYTSVNYEDHLISFTGPGIWNTTGWNWEPITNQYGYPGGYKCSY